MCPTKDLSTPPSTGPETSESKPLQRTVSYETTNPSLCPHTSSSGRADSIVLADAIPYFRYEQLYQFPSISIPISIPHFLPLQIK
jgi:hypothetical protein